jgi:hypothetical protein
MAGMIAQQRRRQTLTSRDGNEAREPGEDCSCKYSKSHEMWFPNCKDCSAIGSREWREKTALSIQRTRSTAKSFAVLRKISQVRH